VITDVESWIKWFDGVNRRAMRDIGGLDDSVLDWKPELGDGEASWTVRELVGHMATSRLFFAQAFSGGEWGMGSNDHGLTGIESCVKLLADSAQETAGLVRQGGDAALTVRVPSFDDPTITIAGWRMLMMIAEHDIHHRSQVMAYAGLNGWPVQQIFGRSYEEVVAARRRSQ
jgi:uncharacterized damage-inducible protein DinB